MYRAYILHLKAISCQELSVNFDKRLFLYTKSPKEYGLFYFFNYSSMGKISKSILLSTSLTRTLVFGGIFPAIINLASGFSITFVK